MNCDVIKDLIPLYSEDLCSPESAAMIEEHLSTCESCKRLLESPEASVPSNSESEAQPFKKVSRRMKARTVFIVLLIILLLAVIIPIGYLTYCQIFKPKGGISFDTLIIEAQARPVADMIANGRASMYVESISGLAANLNPNIIGDKEYIAAVKEKITECYGPVKKYSPAVSSVKAGFFGSSEEYCVTAQIKFTLSSESWLYYDLCLMRQYDGKFLVTNQMTDADFFERSTKDRQAAEDISRYINSITAPAILPDSAVTRNIELAINGLEDDPDDKQIEWAAERVSRYFAAEEKKAAYDGVYDYFKGGYSAKVYFSNFYFDSEKQMRYYIVTVEGKLRGREKAVTIKLFADERGLYPPQAGGDVFGIKASSYDSNEYNEDALLEKLFG